MKLCYIRIDLNILCSSTLREVKIDLDIFVFGGTLSEVVVLCKD